MRKTLAVGLCLFVCAISGCQPADAATGASPAGARAPYVLPYRLCTASHGGAEGDSEVCTQVSIAGCTAEGEAFADYASCEEVRTQRPFSPRPPHRLPDANDPRLDDAGFMREVGWVASQVRACGCVCCHSSALGIGTASWNIDHEGIWTDTITDRGMAILSGRVTSDVFGEFPAAQNNAFDRSATGMPTTDVARLRSFFEGELKRRGVTESQIAEMTPIGGEAMRRLRLPPTPCEGRVGVTRAQEVVWPADLGGVRYVYVSAGDSENNFRTPGPPPNLDLPEGTLWRLDVRPSEVPLEAGLRYGALPRGTSQRVPAEGAPPALVEGRTYHIALLRDVSRPVRSCLFTYPLEG